MKIAYALTLGEDVKVLANLDAGMPYRCKFASDKTTRIASSQSSSANELTADSVAGRV